MSCTLVGLEWVAGVDLGGRAMPLDPRKVKLRILVHSWDLASWEVRPHVEALKYPDAPWTEWMDARGASRLLAGALGSVPGDVEVLATVWWLREQSGLVRVALSAWDRDGCWKTRPGYLLVPFWVERSFMPIVDVLEVMTS